MEAVTGNHVVLGMAGHIDHGKTAIVRALTGTDTDRLKEEKERGMTTDLGFAFLGDAITIIDVPGHEKFVRTMVAGVNTVNLAMLVIAADDGVMPQTREHLEILRLLGIRQGVIAVNKIDLVDEEWRELVLADIRTLVAGSFLEGAPVVPVSTVTGEGVPQLARTVHTLAQQVPPRLDKGVFRLPIDRVFTIRGFGTVVAGTILSGRVHVDDTVDVLPQAIPVRIRGLQVHDRDVTSSGVGHRTALNLQGIEKTAVERGDVLCAPGFYRPTSMVDARLLYLASAGKPLEHRTRVHVHLGTSETVARLQLLDQEEIVPGAEGFVQLHFERPVVADTGDRFVLRSYSPVVTIGGGVVLDVHPARHKRFEAGVRERLERLQQGDPLQMVLEELVREHAALVSHAELARRLSLPADSCRAHLDELERRSAVLRQGQDGWCSTVTVQTIGHRVEDVLKRFHREHPLRLGMLFAEVYSRIKPSLERGLFDLVCSSLLAHGRVVRRGDRLAAADHRVELSPAQEGARRTLVEMLLRHPLMPPGREELVAAGGKDADKLLTLLIETGEIALLEDGILMHRDALAAAERKLLEFFAAHPAGTMSDIRQLLGTSRKYAVPLLTYFDALGMTERDGDLRTLTLRYRNERGKPHEHRP